MHRVTSLLQVVRRPKTTVEGMRWLYAVTAVAALLFTLPAPLSSGVDISPWWALSGAAILSASWLGGYFWRRCPIGFDVVDALALTIITAACPEPAAVFSFAISGLWFRSLYGSVARAVVRCTFYSAGIVAAAPLWPLLAGQGTPLKIMSLVGVFPVMFLVVIVGRLLGACLFSREEAAARDAALAAVGTAMLSLEEPHAILAQAGATSAQICRATPGLRLIAAVVASDTLLRVQGTAGDFDTAPTTLPATVMSPAAYTAGVDGLHDVADSAPLDAAVGQRCSWTAVPMPDGEGWMLLGAPKTVPREAVLAVRSLMNQVALALRNSEVRRELLLQARTDGLTRLANRTALIDRVEHAVHDGGAGVGLLFIDLDDFKPVNDQLGHGAGDELLLEVAQRLIAHTPAGAVCARLGGDEFAVLLPSTTPTDSRSTAEVLVDAIQRPVHLHRGLVNVGASIGVACSTPQLPLTVSQLLHAADLAMYAAKQQGKGGVQTAWIPEDTNQDNPALRDPAPHDPAPSLSGVAAVRSV